MLSAESLVGSSGGTVVIPAGEGRTNTTVVIQRVQRISTVVLLAEVGIGNLDTGFEKALLAAVDEAIPVHEDVPELVVVGGVGGGALLELDNVDRVVNVHLISKILVVDHLHLGELALGTSAIANELVEEGVGLLVVEEEVGSLVGELRVVGVNVLADADVGSTSVGARSIGPALVVFDTSLSIGGGKEGRSNERIALGGRVDDDGVVTFSASTEVSSREFLDCVGRQLFDAEAPLAEVATVVAADAGADGHAGVLAVVGDLDALVLAGDSGLIERRDPVSPHGASGGDGDGGNESLQRELHGCIVLIGFVLFNLFCTV